jgi:hypothetical protein
MKSISYSYTDGFLLGVRMKKLWILAWMLLLTGCTIFENDDITKDFRYPMIEFNPPIAGYRMFYTDKSAEESCDSPKPYYKLYQIDNIEFTTTSLNYANGCVGEISVYIKGIFYPLDAAVYFGYLDINDVQAYDFGYTIIEREIYHQEDEITKFEIYENDQLLVTLMSESNDFQTLKRYYFNLLSFSSEIVTESEYMYTILVYEEDMIFTYDLHEDYIRNVENNTFAPVTNYNGYNIFDRIEIILKHN